MKMPLGITVDEPGEWALRVKNIYGQKQGTSMEPVPD
jgi:hypothetical protein